MYGMKFAALYTLQDRLTRNIKALLNFKWVEGHAD